MASAATTPSSACLKACRHTYHHAAPDILAHVLATKMMFWTLARISFRSAKIVSCNKNIFFHGLRWKLLQLFYFSMQTASIQFCIVSRVQGNQKTTGCVRSTRESKDHGLREDWFCYAEESSRSREEFPCTANCEQAFLGNLGFFDFFWFFWFFWFFDFFKFFWFFWCFF
jgi:hypothetical protein